MLLCTHKKKLVKFAQVLWKFDTHLDSSDGLYKVHVKKWIFKL